MSCNNALKKITEEKLCPILCSSSIILLKDDIREYNLPV